jgi:serine/threonine protein kinase
MGRGGFGEVYYAISDGGKEVALKLVQRHLDVELRGVTQCLNLKHPNLVTIYDVKQAPNGDYWIVMEYVSGSSLSETLAANPNGVPSDQVLAWLRGICSGVGHLHEHGIVHRDLKPGNIFVEHGTVKIGDYGLAKYISASRRSGQTESVGTVHYMAPEISRGRYGKEIDLYALGVILFEMLTGRLPFNGESPGEILMRHLTEPADTSTVPDPFRAVVARLLDKDPSGRPASVHDVLGELNVDSLPEAPQIQSPVQPKEPRRIDRTAAWPPAPAPRQVPSQPQRRYALRYVIAAGLGGLIALLVIAMFTDTRLVRRNSNLQFVSERHLREPSPSVMDIQVPEPPDAPASQDVAAIKSVSIYAIILAVVCLLFIVSRKPRRDLYRAAKAGDISRVRSVLADGGEVDARRCGNRTALIAAAEAGHTAVVQHLLENGADPNARLSNAESALSLATIAGHKSVVEALLEAGADVNSRARDGDSPLIEAAYAGHVAILKMLLERGADTTARSGMDGRTPLIWAAYGGHSACVETLLEYGANPNEKDTGDGSTPIIWAAYGGHPNVVRILLERGADPTETNSDGETALDYAESDAIVALLQTPAVRR